MDERVTTRAEFQEAVRRLAAELGGVVWEQVVEQGQTAAADRWLRAHGGAMLRGLLGAAWTARSERLGVVTLHSLLGFSGLPFSDCVAERHVAGYSMCRVSRHAG